MGAAPELDSSQILALGLEERSSADQSGMVGRCPIIAAVTNDGVAAAPVSPFQMKKPLGLAPVPSPSDARYSVWSGLNVWKPGGCDMPGPARLVPMVRNILDAT